MKKAKRYILIFLILCILVAVLLGGFYLFAPKLPRQTLAKIEEKVIAPIQNTRKFKIGEVIDSFQGVKVYYNGAVTHVLGRRTTPDGYNLGLEYQCVEFVKRYYYEHFDHKMPNASGNAKDFFSPSLADGAWNTKRNLYQFTNNSVNKPQIHDILIWNGNIGNPYGHVAIICDTLPNYIQIIQQNPGPGAPSREWLPIVYYKGKWKVCVRGILGWLHKPPADAH